MTTRRVWIDSRAARRAIYIGFVATRNGDASVLGTACEDRWIANIVTPELELLSKRRSRNRDLRMADTAEVLRELRDRAIAEDRHIMAWSLEDIAAIRAALPPDEMLWWDQNLVNAQQVARNWKTLNIGWVSIRPTPGPQPNLNPITSYMWAAGYGIPACMRWQPAGAWECMKLRRSLADNPSIEDLPQRSIESWIDVVDHNRHLCLGLADVMRMVGLGIGLAAYDPASLRHRGIHRPRRPRLPRLPRREPGDPIGALEVLSTVPRRSAGETVWSSTRANELEAFGRAWSDDEAFFVVGPTAKAWSIVLITDADSTPIYRGDIPFDGHGDLDTALDTAANLNWFIDRIPTGAWRLPAPEPSVPTP